MNAHDVTFWDDPAKLLGLIVLQADRRIEADFRQLLPGGANLFVSRVASAPEVTSETLGAMEGDLGRAASLFPRGMTFDAVGYGCTSGTAAIGADRVAELIGGAIATRAVTNPVTALIAACREGGLRRLGIVSPYLAPVANKLCQVLNDDWIETPLRTDFGIAEEAEVARIDCETLVTAATELARQGGIDAVFLSCTNLDTLEALRRLRARLDMPVMSSNTVLEWHMVRLAGIQRQKG